MLAKQKNIILSLAAIVWLTLGGASKTLIADETVGLRSVLLEYLANLPNRNLVNRPIVVEKGDVVIGERRLLISPVVENYIEQRGMHYYGVRFEITIDSIPQPRLTFGIVGSGTTRKEAARNAIAQWDFIFGKALFRATAQVPADKEMENFSVYMGGLITKGETHGISLEEFVQPQEIFDMLSTMLPRRDGSLHTIQFILEIDNRHIIGGECRIDGQLDAKMCESLGNLIWPRTPSKYMLKQAFLFE
jgi:hypothetical protein